MKTSDIPERSTRFLSVKDLASQPACPFTEASLRHFIFYAESRLAANGEIIPGNGLGRAILRIGRKVLIDEYGFYEWIANHYIEPPD